MIFENDNMKIIYYKFDFQQKIPKKMNNFIIKIKQKSFNFRPRPIKLFCLIVAQSIITSTMNMSFVLYIGIIKAEKVETVQK